MDAVPLFSQIKSFAQWASGNSEGARETQKNFLKMCPVVSQRTSLVQAIAGDWEGARETQIQFLMFVDGMVDSVPVVGHVKGAVHYVCGDKERGDNAMKAASHTTGVIGGGVGGFLVGGPVGAAAGGAYGGVLMDGIISLAEVAVDGEKAKPYGFLENVVHIANNPMDGGSYVDLIGSIVLDGWTGYTVVNAIIKKIEYNCNKRNLAKAVGEKYATRIVDLGDEMRQINYDTGKKNNKPHVMTRVINDATGEYFDGHNKQMRKVLKIPKDITNGPTELQKRVPGAKQVLDRPVNTCSEQHAYHNLYTNNPDASPKNLKSVSVKWNPESKGPNTVPRCSNCREFSPAMGDVPTDLIPETPVPKRVRFREAALVVALGVGVQALCVNVESEDI
ncbi:hypothetical protein ACJMK2_022991 [Sinanodonta woodiana]|uniref:Uncharacterized protein n=1 Tax=Sinanodonta woodiana TaxID=1069815 RepID=A0ABD3TLP2_SINWO